MNKLDFLRLARERRHNNIISVRSELCVSVPVYCSTQHLTYADVTTLLVTSTPYREPVAPDAKSNP